MSIIIPANSAVGGGYDVDNSLRFNRGSSDYLNRTPSSASNRRTWTFSTWLKKSSIGTYQSIFASGAYPNTFQLWFDDTKNNLRAANFLSANVNLDLNTNRKFRDFSAFYNIVLSIDTTQGTDTNRVKLYINGVQETSFELMTYPSQNADLDINTTNAHYIGNTSSSLLY